MNMKKAMLAFCLVSGLLGAGMIVAKETTQNSNHSEVEKKSNSLKKVLQNGKKFWHKQDKVEKTCLGAVATGILIVAIGTIKNLGK